jgi:hypothetical protein
MPFGQKVDFAVHARIVGGRATMTTRIFDDFSSGIYPRNSSFTAWFLTSLPLK